MFGQQSGNQMASRFDGTPITKWLLISNIIIFFLDIGGVGDFSMGRLTPTWAYEIQSALGGGELWRVVTFQFMHGSLGHLFFNMYAIYMFGGIVERLLGSRRYAVYYLLCGIAGALFYTILVAVGWLLPGILVGASAGIFGILVALIVIAPEMQVTLLFPPIPMKLKTFGMVILGIGALTVLTSGNNAGGEAAHLGGALLGFLLMRNPSLLNWVDQIGMVKGGAKTKHSRPYEAKLRPRARVREESPEVDRILEKVSEHGLHSLTEAERQTLKDISNKD